YGRQRRTQTAARSANSRGRRGVNKLVSVFCSVATQTPNPAGGEGEAGPAKPISREPARVALAGAAAGAARRPGGSCGPCPAGGAAPAPCRHGVGGRADKRP